MSNIYISEPHTNGKVVLNTSCGEIEIELWSKEAPLACRNFVQLCMEGYYDHTIFHRVVRKFIVQGGDPTGSGDGGESIYGEPFKMEIHSRLRFNRRALVAMYCSDDKVVGSQFFFTLSEAPELQGCHTIFGTVVGTTIYNMINLGEGIIDKQTERPLDPQSIINAVVIANPFTDIQPRAKPVIKADEEPKSLMSAVKDYTLLSFGDDIDDDDDNDEMPRLKRKGKSAHDHSKHSNLSTEMVKISASDERIVEAPIELTVAISEKPSRIKEEQERIDKLREQSRLIEQQLVSDFLKERNAAEDSKADDNHVLKSLSVNSRSIDHSQMLKNFSMRLKSTNTNEWFYKPLTLGETDEIEKQVFDPDVYNPEKYDLHDPRNPLNQRKRQADDSLHHGKSKSKRNE